MRSRRPHRIAVLAALAGILGCVDIQVIDWRLQPLEETVVAGERGPKILLLDLSGVISEVAESAGVLEPQEVGSAARVREALDRARRDDEIRALILRIDSPGGSVTASDLVYREIQRFRNERGVPVIAQLMGTAASGGYYVAQAADEIIAHPTTITGSIGVIYFGVNVAGLMEKLGIEDQTLTTGSFKDAGSPLRRMTAEERAQLRSILLDMQAEFERVVDAGRPKLDAAGVHALADGRIFSAPQALAAGLVDRIGDLETAIDSAKQRAGIGEARVVNYHRPQQYRSNVYSAAPLPLPALDPRGWLPRALRDGGFFYLWQPSL
jgi:protease-4